MTAIRALAVLLITVAAAGRGRAGGPPVQGPQPAGLPCSGPPIRRCC
ncbi:hypothetical protein [Streptomyces sp. NPDC048349]